MYRKKQHRQPAGEALSTEDDQRLGQRVDAVVEAECRRVQVAQDAEGEQGILLHGCDQFRRLGIALNKAEQVQQLHLVRVGPVLIGPLRAGCGKLAVEIIKVPLVAETLFVQRVDIAAEQMRR